MSTTTIRRPAATGRRTLGALRALLAPVRRPSGATKGVGSTDTPAPVAEQHAEQLADVFAADELPPLADITAACEQYAAATESARAADRSKRKARKALDALDDGQYGPWRVFRKPSERVTPDLEKIAAVFEAYQLGPIPMRPVADSLKVERVMAPARAA